MNTEQNLRKVSLLLIALSAAVLVALVSMSDTRAQIDRQIDTPPLADPFLSP